MKGIDSTGAALVHVPGWVGGWMGGWVDGWMDGWVDGSKSHFKDCLQQSKIVLWKPVLAPYTRMRIHILFHFFIVIGPLV